MLWLFLFFAFLEPVIALFKVVLFLGKALDAFYDTTVLFLFFVNSRKVSKLVLIERHCLRQRAERCEKPVVFNRKGVKVQ